MNCIEDCSNAFLFQCHAAGGPEHSYRALKPLQEVRLPVRLSGSFTGPEKISIVCPLPHCRCISNISWTSGNMYLWMCIKQGMWMCRDISVLFRNPAPLKKWDLSQGISLAALTEVVFSRAHRGCAEGRLHFSIAVKCQSV